MFIRSGGDLYDGAIVWRIEDEEIDFSVSEFETLMAELRRERLFAHLAVHRPALKARLLALFDDSLARQEFEVGELELALENALLQLENRLSHR